MRTSIGLLLAVSLVTFVPAAVADETQSDNEGGGDLIGPINTSLIGFVYNL